MEVWLQSMDDGGLDTKHNIQHIRLRERDVWIMRVPTILVIVGKQIMKHGSIWHKKSPSTGRNNIHLSYTHVRVMYILETRKNGPHFI